MKSDINYDLPPGTIARHIFQQEGRIRQQHSVAECPPEKRELVRKHLNTFRLRRKYCDEFKVPFWL